MPSDSFTNFATSQLASPSPLTSNGSSFSVTGGQGVLFPTSNFMVVIDTEIILISSRNVDAFTIAGGGRGYDGTIAATHTVGATVQLSLTRSHLKHLWQQVADTYHPDVPPIQLASGSPSIYDNEFETLGSWFTSPGPGAGTTFSIGSTVQSHLVLNRGTNDSANYTAYVPISTSGAFTVTCKFSHATSFLHTNTQDECQFHLFATDQSNPASGPDTGNRVKYDDVVKVGSPYHYSRAALDTSGNFSQLSGNNYIYGLSTPMFARLTYDGAGNWGIFVGDGYTYWQLGAKSNFLTNPVTIGVNAHLLLFSGGWMQQVVLVDYVRVKLGTVLPPYAN